MLSHVPSRAEPRDALHGELGLYAEHLYR
jgi:hypothetical protein